MAESEHRAALPHRPGKGINRRKYERCSATADVHLVRASGAVRREIAVSLVDVSAGGIGVCSTEPFWEGERVVIRLKNDVLRYAKELPGVICWVHDATGVVFRLGIEFDSRLSPYDLVGLAAFSSLRSLGSCKAKIAAGQTFPDVSV